MTPRTLASLPLPEILWQLAPHVPEILLAGSAGVKRVHAWGLDIDAWPAQHLHASTLAGTPSAFDALTMSLLSHAADQGFTPKLEFASGVEWRCELFVIPNGWLTGKGLDEQAPVLHAVAGACLLAFEIKAGRTGWLA